MNFFVGNNIFSNTISVTQVQQQRTQLITEYTLSGPVYTKKIKKQIKPKK
jgi:hypothetical protein